MQLKLAGLCLICAVAAFAQGDRGTITGTVSDPTGAVVPNANIQITNSDTSAVYKVATTNTGNYTLANLPVGNYVLIVEAQGFKKFERPGLVVQVAETERVFRNLSAVLKAAGRSFDHVARAGVYLTSMSDFVAMNGIYAKHFTQPFPARTTIGVAALPLGACVEIDLVVKA